MSFSECYVCYNQTSIKLNCKCLKTYFCEECAKKWYNKVPRHKFSCPICRENIHNNFEFSLLTEEEILNGIKPSEEITNIEIVATNNGPLYVLDVEITDEENEENSLYEFSDYEYYNEDEDDKTIDYIDYGGIVYESSDEEYDEYNRRVVNM